MAQLYTHEAGGSLFLIILYTKLYIYLSIGDLKDLQ